MIKRLMILDGVTAACQFRDDGSLIEGYGLAGNQQLEKLAQFGHEFRRMVQGNADQLSMFAQMRGWTPPRGWIVRGPEASICSVANLVCVLETAQARVDEVLIEMDEVSRW